MKKTASAALIVAALAAATHAQAGIMVGIGMGNTGLDAGSADLGSDNNMRLSLEGIKNDTKSALGLRASYSDFGDFDFDIAATHIGLDLVYRHQLIESGDLLLNAGLGRVDIEQEYVTNWGAVTAEYSELTYQVGIGYRHHFGQFSVQADYSITDVLDSDFDATFSGFTIGANYAF